jgi:hypothetical protein
MLISFRTPTREDKALVQRSGSPLTTTAGPESDGRGRSLNDIAEPDIFISDEPGKPDAPEVRGRICLAFPIWIFSLS